MPKSMEELGAYGEQPDRKVTAFDPDPVDPSFSTVTFNDGTTETMPTSQAEALPQEPALADPAGGLPPMGPPPPPVDPNAPNAVAQAWDAAGQDPIVAATEATTAPPGFVPPVGRPTNPLPDTPGGASELPAPTVDMGEIVGPGSLGGMAPYGESDTASSQETERVEDPNVALGRVDDAYTADAQARQLRDSMKYSTQRDSLDAEDDARAAAQAQLEDQLAQAEAEKRQQERVYQAIEKTPIDEDGFWSESPGRAAGAWIALALSGFLQGATRGQNPALNQMVQALNHAQDRYLQNQMKSREGQLRTRERMIGDRSTAVASMKLQLSGIMEKRIMLDAQREGLTPPPALATYLAEGQVKRAEAKTTIGQQTVRVATEQRQRESRATPGTGPVTRFDAAIQSLGVDRKKHQEAMASGLGDQVRSSDEMRQIAAGLKRIAAANGGQLPAQGTMSWTQLGLAPLAARLGIKNAEEQVNTTQLLNQASLAYMSAIGNIKGMDSNVERAKFDQILNSGEGATTIAAITDRAAMAENAAVSAASGFAGGNARRYVDLLRSQQAEPSREGPQIKARTGFRVAAPPTESGDQTDQAGGGSPAPGPLARPAAKALETSTTGSRPATYQRLRGSKPNVRP
jgi:hypothetical protein